MENRLRRMLGNVHAEPDLKARTARMMQDAVRQQTEQPEAEQPAPRRRARARLVLACAAVLALLLVGGGVGGYLYATPSAHIDVDVNPSLALDVNRFGRVIGASAYNDDGKSVLQNLNLRNMRYDDALKTLVGAMADAGYLSTADGLLAVTVQSEYGAAQDVLLANLQGAADQSLQTLGLGAQADVFAVSEDVRACAHAEQMSPAKYLAVLDLQAVDPTATFDGYRGMGVGAIRQRTRECAEGHGQGQGGAGQGQHGHGADDHAGQNAAGSPSQSLPPSSLPWEDEADGYGRQRHGNDGVHGS